MTTTATRDKARAILLAWSIVDSRFEGSEISKQLHADATAKLGEQALELLRDTYGPHDAETSDGDIALWFVVAETDEGYNMDLHVLAVDLGDALAIWRDHFADIFDVPDDVDPASFIGAVRAQQVVMPGDLVQTDLQPRSLGWNLQDVELPAA